MQWYAFGNSSRVYVTKSIVRSTAEDGGTAMSGSSLELGMSEPRYQVILLRKGKCILTPGELSLEEAEKKASYLSQYGQVSILGCELHFIRQVGPLYHVVGCLKG